LNYLNQCNPLDFPNPFSPKPFHLNFKLKLSPVTKNKRYPIAKAY